MSRHISRNERWTKMNAKEHRSAFGVVRYRAGAWEGLVVFEIHNAADNEWKTEEQIVGRFKRPRNAMIAVEDKAREMQRKLGDKAKVLIE